MHYTATITADAGLHHDAKALLEIRAASIADVVREGEDGETVTESVETDHGAQVRMDLLGEVSGARDPSDWKWTHAKADQALADLGWRTKSKWQLAKDDGPRRWSAPVEHV